MASKAKFLVSFKAFWAIFGRFFRWFFGPFFMLLNCHPGFQPWQPYFPTHYWRLDIDSGDNARNALYHEHVSSEAAAALKFEAVASAASLPLCTPRAHWRCQVTRRPARARALSRSHRPQSNILVGGPCMYIYRGLRLQ